MSCCPNDLFELANALCGSEGGNEALVRCATSRGYYAVLHTVANVIPSMPGVTRQKNEGTHAFVVRRALKYGDGPNPGRLEARRIAHNMQRLKGQRVIADYDLDSDYRKEDGGDALARATVIFGYCEALRAAIASKDVESTTEVVGEAESISESLTRPALKRIR